MPVPLYFDFSPVPYRQGQGYAKLGAAHKKTHQASKGQYDRQTYVRETVRPPGSRVFGRALSVTPSQKAEQSRAAVDGRMNEREKYNRVTSRMPKGESGEDK